jgi:hypothetical protein
MYASVRDRQLNCVSTARIRCLLSKSDLVERLRLERVLDGHQGCVNTAVRLSHMQSLYHHCLPTHTARLCMRFCSIILCIAC